MPHNELDLKEENEKWEKLLLKNRPSFLTRRLKLPILSSLENLENKILKGEEDGN